MERRKSKSRQDWMTPGWFREYVKNAYGSYPCVDAAATDNNKFGLERCADGLMDAWFDRNDRLVWCNPPFSEMDLWVDKALEERRFLSKHQRILLLTPNSTDTKWWGKLIERGAGWCYFITPRIGFYHPDETNDRPGFGCVLWELTDEYAGNWQYRVRDVGYWKKNFPREVVG